MIIGHDENGCPIRNCANPDCDREIHLCNGFCKAGDIIRLDNGEITWEEVRELCGLYILKVQWNRHSELELQPHYRKFLEQQETTR